MEQGFVASSRPFRPWEDIVGREGADFFAWRCLAPVGQGALRGCGATLLACGKGTSGRRAPGFGILGWRRRAKFFRVQAGLLPGARGTAGGVF